ncbi:hypothetical protein TeGR_g5173, partial [Tetraparma gracilis]
ELQSILAASAVAPNHTVYRASPVQSDGEAEENLRAILEEQAAEPAPETLPRGHVPRLQPSGGPVYDDSYKDPYAHLLSHTPMPTSPSPLPDQPSTFYTSTPPPLPSTFPAAQAALHSHFLASVPPSTAPIIVTDAICGEAVLRGASVYSPGPFPLLYLGVSVFRLPKKADCFSSQRGLAAQVARLDASGPLPSLNALGGAAYAGCYYSQNLPSLLPPRALAPGAEEACLDMCCAPGGKTSHLASLMRRAQAGNPGGPNEGFVICSDRSKSKIKKVKGLMKEQGLDGLVYAFAADSTKLYDPSLSPTTAAELRARISSKNPPHPLAFPPNTFNKILLDPPCSALGLRPRLSLSGSTAAVVEGFAKYQKGFVHSAVHLLKVGGTLSYSTCTFNPDENELMVRYILDHYPSMRLADVGSPYGKYGIAGCGLSEEERGKVRRFDASGREGWVGGEGCLNRSLDTIGFFVALFVKDSEIPAE